MIRFLLRSDCIQKLFKYSYSIVIKTFDQTRYLLFSLFKKTPITALCLFLKQSFTISNLRVFKNSCLCDTLSKVASLVFDVFLSKGKNMGFLADNI